LPSRSAMVASVPPQLWSSASPMTSTASAAEQVLEPLGASSEVCHENADGSQTHRRTVHRNSHSHAREATGRVDSGIQGRAERQPKTSDVAGASSALR
jgi:hypothetical protein